MSDRAVIEEIKRFGGSAQRAATRPHSANIFAGDLHAGLVRNLRKVGVSPLASPPT
jgi:hypothetical protein